MKKGHMFRVDETEYVIALCTDTEDGNAALLLSQSGMNRCMTVSNLRTDGSGKYFWELGHAASNYDEAVQDFITRLEN